MWSVLNAHTHTHTRKHTHAHIHTQKKGPKTEKKCTKRLKKWCLKELQVTSSILLKILYFLNMHYLYNQEILLKIYFTTLPIIFFLPFLVAFSVLVDGNPTCSAGNPSHSRPFLSFIPTPNLPFVILVLPTSDPRSFPVTDRLCSCLLNWFPHLSPSPLSIPPENHLLYRLYHCQPNCSLARCRRSRKIQMPALKASPSPSPTAHLPHASL